MDVPQNIARIQQSSGSLRLFDIHVERVHQRARMLERIALNHVRELRAGIEHVVLIPVCRLQQHRHIFLPGVIVNALERLSQYVQMLFSILIRADIALDAADRHPRIQLRRTVDKRAHPLKQFLLPLLICIAQMKPISAVDRARPKRRHFHARFPHARLNGRNIQNRDVRHMDFNGVIPHFMRFAHLLAKIAAQRHGGRRAAGHIGRYTVFHRFFLHVFSF